MCFPNVCDCLKQTKHELRIVVGVETLVENNKNLTIKWHHGLPNRKKGTKPVVLGFIAAPE